MRSFVLAAVCLLVAVAAVHAQDERTKRLNEDQAAFESSEQVRKAFVGRAAMCAVRGLQGL
jgi:hypothetical protein